MYIHIYIYIYIYISAAAWTSVPWMTASRFTLRKSHCMFGSLNRIMAQIYAIVTSELSASNAIYNS